MLFVSDKIKTGLPKSDEKTKALSQTHSESETMTKENAPEEQYSEDIS
jgi:hypothetical protein